MSGLLSKFQEHVDWSKTTNEQFNKALEKLESENQSEHKSIRQIIECMKRETEEKEEQTHRRFNEVDEKIEDARKSTDERWNKFEVMVERAIEIRKKRFNDADTSTATTKNTRQNRLEELKAKVDETENNTEKRFNGVYKTLSDAEENTDKRFSDLDTKMAEDKKNTEKRFEDIIKMIKGAEKDTYNRLTLQGQSIVNAVNETQHRFSTFENNMEMIGNSLIDSNKRIEDLTKTVLLTICQCQNKHDHVVNIVDNLARTTMCIAAKRTTMCIAAKREKERFPDTVEEWLDNLDFSTCDANLDEQAIMKISKCIYPNRILEVGLMLGLTHHDIDQIQLDHDSTSRQAYEVILKWRNKMGQKANFNSLVGKLFEAGQEDAGNVNVNALTNALVTIVETA